MSSDPSGTSPNSTRPAIRVDNVSKRYFMFERPEDRFKQMVVPRLQRLVGRPPKRYFRDFAALNSVSLEVGRGETVGIIGRNGSGKSTLLQIICGTLQPTSGAVEVNGRIAALLELGAGFNPEFTGRENVFLNAAILGVPRQEIEWRFDDIAGFADIGPFIDQPVKTYSSGMYVRLAFATAINVDPDILVVDEALSVGDEAFQRKCFARLEDIKDKGGTILFVSHGAQTIVQLCTRAILIDAGEKLLEGAPKRVVRQYQRLVNASTEGAALIRPQIVAMRDTLQVDDSPVSINNLETGSNVAVMGRESLRVEDSVAESASDEASRPVDSNWPRAVPPPPTEVDAIADCYDPHLVTQSAVSLEERGARIGNVKITTLGGETVNVLRMGKRYVFTEQIDFHADASQVSFGVQFRTASGIAIAGAHTSYSKSLVVERLSRGAVVRTRFEFTCILLPGVYFAVCGVRGKLADEEIVMHRIFDALAFRVAPETDLIATGQADADFSFSLAI